MSRQLHVCYLGTYDREHVRNRVIMDGLGRVGAKVIEVHGEIWRDTAQRVASARRGLLQPQLWWRLIRTYAQLAWRYLRCPAHDLVIVGHPGSLDLPLARLLTWLRRKPLVFDALISPYETVVDDRALLAPHSLTARALLWLERLLYRLPDRVLVDTGAQVQFLQQRFGAPPHKLRLVWVGAPDTVTEPPGAPDPNVFRVVYFGKFIPLHGLELVLQAANLLREQREIRFELFGDGQTYPQMRALARELGLENVVFVPEWLPLPQLAERVAGAGVCLGIFGAGAKTQRVIPIKAYLALAWCLPLITGDTVGISELLRDGEHALLCDGRDPASLARGILRLYRDPALAGRLARQGRALYEQSCTPTAVGAAVLAIAGELLRQEPGTAEA